MELNKENVKKIIGMIAFGILFYVILQNITVVKNVFVYMIEILSPFLIGAGFAFILNIPMRALEKKLFKPKKMKNGNLKQNRFKRPVCIILAFILMMIIIGLIIKLVIPQLISVIVMFVREVPDMAYNVKEWAIALTEQYPDISSQIQNIEINWNSIVNDIINFVSNLASSLVTSSIGFIIGLIGGIFNAIISIVFAVYILVSKEKLAEQFKKIIRAYFSDEKAKYILEIARLSKNTFNNFLTGQLIEAIILGTLCFIGMVILRLPFAATISILVGVTALIPIIGAFLGIIVGAILILSIVPIKALVFIVFLLILQQFETNVIYPRVVGNSVGLPGIWVLVAVAVGGSLGGMFGLIIGLPTVSVFYTILRNDVNKRLKNKREAEKIS